MSLAAVGEGSHMNMNGFSCQLLCNGSTFECVNSNEISLIRCKLNNLLLKVEVHAASAQLGLIH